MVPHRCPPNPKAPCRESSQQGNHRRPLRCHENAAARTVLVRRERQVGSSDHHFRKSAPPSLPSERTDCTQSCNLPERVQLKCTTTCESNENVLSFTQHLVITFPCAKPITFDNIALGSAFCHTAMLTVASLCYGYGASRDSSHKTLG